MARAGLPSVWAELYQMGRMVSFSIPRYGEAACVVMAQAWCKKCQFFYDIYCAADNVNYNYSAGDIASYEADAVLVELVLERGVDDPLWDRGFAVHNLVPVRLSDLDKIT